MATTPSTSGAGGVLYRLDGQLRVAAFVELALARPRRDEAPGASDAATAPVAVGESYLSRVGCVRPGFLVRSIDDLRRGEATSMPHFHRWSAAPPVAMSPARCVATWINRGDDAVVIELPVRGAQASAVAGSPVTPLELRRSDDPAVDADDAAYVLAGVHSGEAAAVAWLFAAQTRGDARRVARAEARRVGRPAPPERRSVRVSLAGSPRVGDLGASAIAAALRAAPTRAPDDVRLRALDLSRCAVGDAGCAALATACRGLEVLALRANDVGAVGAAALAATLATQLAPRRRSPSRRKRKAEAGEPPAPPAPAGLRELDLSENGRVGSRGAVALAAALRTNGALEVLSLDACRVGASGAGALGAVLSEARGNRTLRVLRLNGYRLSDACVARLVADVAAASVEALHCAVAGGGAGGDASDEDEAHRVADAVGLARAAPRDAASSAAARAARVGAVGVGSRELSAVWVGDGDARAAGDRAPAVAAAATPVEPLALHRVALPPAVAVRAAPRLLELRLGGGGAAHAARYFAHAMRCGAAPALRSLEVDDAGLDGAVVQGLMAAVATHATLESLSIRGSPVGTAAARAVACALAQAPALARVDLRGTIAASGVGASHVCAGVAANGRLAELGGVALGRGLAALGVGGGAVAELSNAALLPNLGALVAAPAPAAGGGGGEPSDDARRRRQLQLLANVARLPFDLDELKELYRFFFCAAPPRDFDEGADAPPRAAALPRPPGAGERRALDGATPRVDAFPRLAARLRADLAARAACADPAARFDALRDVLVRLRQLRYYGMQERGDWLTRRTLVVDDSETTRRLLRRSFENAGFLVDAARDGREALVCMRRTPYDLVIMDLEMPVMDGWRSTRELRAWERDAPAGVRPQRVCAVSAEPQRRDGALRSGADAFEAKPLRVSSLLEMSTRVAAEAAERLDAALDASGEASDAGGASSDGAAGSARPARFEPRLPPPDALEDALMLECAGVFAAPAAKRSRAAGAAEAPAPSSPLASGPGGVDSV